ncbi:helix-turn-helix domain-containing protein [Geminisphaera colitermitum]|uniref:helix-turn-helix domain-containing protein n=1 Tax=Geminisphaera colitermitum TaxID=1148786 RepID=UPI0009DFA771|nr:AraC family transcriptional regulator [Geminisphaera colitermitum]
MDLFSAPVQNIVPLPFSSICLNSKPRRYRCPANWSWNTRLDDYDLWMPLGGKGVLTINGEALPVTAPMAVLLRPGETVSGVHDPAMPFEVVALHFTPRCRNRAEAFEWAGRMRAVPLYPAAMWSEFADLIVSQLMADDDLARQQASPLVMSLLSGLWRLAQTPAAQAGDERLEVLIRNIQREPERTWSLECMMREAQMGATRLNRRFRERTGLSPARWVIRCRVERAALLLRETPMKIAAIAEACGYADVYFFARQFHQITGRPPGAWRRRE